MTVAPVRSRVRWVDTSTPPRSSTVRSSMKVGSAAGVFSGKNSPKYTVSPPATGAKCAAGMPTATSARTTRWPYMESLGASSMNDAAAEQRMLGSGRVPSRSVVVVARDLPDHPGLRDLDQRPVGGAPNESAVRIGLAEVADRAVVDEVERSVGSELHLEGSVDPAQPADESLIGGCVFPGHLVDAPGSAVRIVRLVLLAAVEGEARQRELQRLPGLAEIHQLDVMPRFRLAVPLGEAEVTLAGHQGRSPVHHPSGEGVGREVGTDYRNVGWLEGERRRGRLREVVEHATHRRVLGDHARRRLQVVTGPADRIEDRLRGVEESEAIWPAVEVRRSIPILPGQCEPVRSVVGRPGAALVLAVLGHEQAALQRMVLRSET